MDEYWRFVEDEIWESQHQNWIPSLILQYNVFRHSLFYTFFEDSLIDVLWKDLFSSQILLNKINETENNPNFQYSHTSMAPLWNTLDQFEFYNVNCKQDEISFHQQTALFSLHDIP